MNFKYAENETCCCGNKAKFEISDDKGALFFCDECVKNLACGYLGIMNLKNKVDSKDSLKKPNNLYQDIGDISFEHNGETITVDPHICMDYSPVIYVRKTKQFVQFDWNDLTNIASNLVNLDKK